MNNNLTTISNVNIKVKITDVNAILPRRATQGSVGYDLHILDELVMEPFTIYKIRTGLAFEIPPGYFMDIRPRSGLSLKGFVLVNSPGTIDSDYRGEIYILARFIPVGIDDLSLKLEKGSRVAQAVFLPVVSADFNIVSELESSDRGEGGFGHTGIK